MLGIQETLFQVYLKSHLIIRKFMTITQGKENNIFKDTQTKFYINNYLRFDNNIVTPIISKCACSTLAALANNYPIDDVYKPIIWGGDKKIQY